VGAVVTVFGMLAAFVPGADVSSIAVFELKMAAGVGVPMAIGLWLFWRARRVRA
jgi:hypothetical protein